MRDEGATVEDIVARLEKVQDNTHLYVIVDTLENLIKGGRIGKGTGFIGSLLNIKVIANLEGGVYNPVSKVRSHKQVVNFYLNNSKQIQPEKQLRQSAFPMQMA